MCKGLYNDLKNVSRLAEQHREAAENRRLLSALSGETKIESITKILERFAYCCFNCSLPLQNQQGGAAGYHLDHTLPVSWLWPLNHGPTVLCRDCNGRKSDRWPSEFYSRDKLKELSARTGIPFQDLSGKPFFNPHAVERLCAEADSVIEQWIDYPEKLRALGTRILAATEQDIFADASPESLRAIGLAG